MKLFLISYASAAIVVPALWIGVRLWLRRHSQTPAPGFVSAQIIAFPIAMVASNRRRDATPLGNERAAAHAQPTMALAESGPVRRGETTIPISEIVSVTSTDEVTEPKPRMPRPITLGSQFWISRH